MSASVCELREMESLACDLHDVEIFSRGVTAQPARHCPHCGSLVYSRRHKLCGVCAEPLPNTCLFSNEQSERVEVLLQEERARHRSWLNRFEN
jgi:hypothetical protein